MKNKVITIALVGSIIGGCLFLTKIMRQSKGKTRFTIGIVQTASHPALDEARAGFVETLQKQLNNDVAFIIRNAEGNITNIHTIAQHFHNRQDIDGIFAIATPAVQAMALVEKERPIFIAAVTDPHALGIIHPKTNVCGTTDMIDVAKEIDALHLFLPNIKTIALIFNSAEINATTLVKQMVVALKNKGITPLEIAITSETDIPGAIATALRKADALLAPTDNMIASAISFIAKEAHKARKPLIVSDNLLVKHGALMARGVDYRKSGQQVAHIALQIIVHGKKPHEIPLASADNRQIFINKGLLKDFNLTIPQALMPDVVLVDCE